MKLDLIKILKGHEGETFYNPLFGSVNLSYIDENHIVFSYNLGRNELFVKHNGNSIYTDELVVFPSKYQKDWEKWEYENNPELPKTWNKLVKSDIGDIVGYNVESYYRDRPQPLCHTSIEKSALALLKIHQLIEISYGRNINKKEWLDNSYKYAIYPDFEDNEIHFNICRTDFSSKRHIAFHTLKLAEEFLSYPENMQLLKDYYMI